MNTKILTLCITLAAALAVPAAQASPFGWFHQFNGSGLSMSDANVTSEALQAAARPDIQQIAGHIFCYCGCDVEHGHRSLLDCYRTGHVPVCHTCANEFVRISQMEAQHQSLAQMQDTIDSQFGHAYPFHQRSAILNQYISSKEHNQM